MKNKKNSAILALLVITVFSIFLAACGSMGDANAGDPSIPNGGLIDLSQTGGTLTQDAKVDEGDIVKTFGNRMFKLQSDGIAVYDLESGDAFLVAYYKVSGSRIVPLEMFVSDNVIVGVFGKTNKATDLYTNNDKNPTYTKTVVKAFDASLASKDAPLDLSEQEKYSFEVNATMIATRMYTFSKQAYFAFSIVNNYTGYQSGDGIEGTYVSLVPSYVENGESKRIDAFEPIPQLYSENGTTWEKGSSATLFMSINTNELEENAVISGCYGATLQDLYMSETSIIPIYKNTYRKVESQGCNKTSYTTSYTYTMKINSETLRIVDGVRFEGYTIYDRRAIKDFGDYIYVTATKTDGSGSTVISFDGNTFGKINSLTKIAAGETVKSVAYEETATGERYCYITTFREVDPLFKVNITDPYRMLTEGYIKMSGFSTFMLPVGDKLLTLGYADNGAQNRRSIVRIAMYDTASGGIEPIDELLLENVVECEAISDPRAICVFGNIVSFSARTAAHDYYNDGYQSRYGYYQGLYSFMITESEIIQLKTLSNYGYANDYGHMSNFAFYDNKYYQIFDELSYLVQIDRARIIDGYIYTVSDGLISSYPINLETGEIDLFSVKQTVTSLIEPTNLRYYEIEGMGGNDSSSSSSGSSSSSDGGGGSFDVEPDGSNDSKDSSSGDGSFETVS